MYRPSFIPIIPISFKDEDKPKLTSELEKKLLEHIDKKIASLTIPSGANINITELKTQIKSDLKKDIKEIITDEYVTLKLHEMDLKQLEFKMMQAFKTALKEKFDALKQDFEKQKETVRNTFFLTTRQIAETDEKVDSNKDSIEKGVEILNKLKQDFTEQKEIVRNNLLLTTRLIAETDEKVESNNESIKKGVEILNKLKQDFEQLKTSFTSSGIDKFGKRINDLEQRIPNRETITEEITQQIISLRSEFDTQLEGIEQRLTRLLRKVNTRLPQYDNIIRRLNALEQSINIRNRDLLILKRKKTEFEQQISNIDRRLQTLDTNSINFTTFLGDNTKTLIQREEDLLRRIGETIGQSKQENDAYVDQRLGVINTRLSKLEQYKELLGGLDQRLVDMNRLLEDKISRTELQTLTKDMGKLQRDITQIKSKLGRNEVMFRDKITEIEGTFAAFNKRLRQVAETVSRNEELLNANTAKIQELDTKLTTIEQTLANKINRQEFDTLKQEKDKLIEDITKLRTDLTRKLGVNNSKISVLDSQITGLNKRVSSLNKVITANDEKLIQVEKDIIANNERIKAIEEISAQQAERIKTLSAQQDERIKTLSAQQDERIKTLSAQQAERINTLSAQQAERINTLSAQQDERINTLSAQQAERINTLSAQQAERINTLSAQQVAMDGKLEEFNRRLTDEIRAREQFVSLVREKDELIADMKKLRIDIEANIDRYKDDRDLFIEVIDSVRENNTSLIEQVEFVQDRLSDEIEERRKLEQLVTEYKQIIDRAAEEQRRREAAAAAAEEQRRREAEAAAAAEQRRREAEAAAEQRRREAEAAAAAEQRRREEAAAAAEEQRRKEAAAEETRRRKVEEEMMAQNIAFKTQIDNLVGEIKGHKLFNIEILRKIQIDIRQLQRNIDEKTSNGDANELAFKILKTIASLINASTSDNIDEQIRLINIRIDEIKKDKTETKEVAKPSEIENYNMERIKEIEEFKTQLNDKLRSLTIDTIAKMNIASSLVEEEIDKLKQHFDKKQTEILEIFGQNIRDLIRTNPQNKDSLQQELREKISEIRELGRSYKTQLTEYKENKLRFLTEELRRIQRGSGYIEIYSDESELIEPSRLNYALSETSSDN